MIHVHSKANLLSPLSEEELYQLGQFLLSETTSDETMMLDELDGYLTAIIIGPTTLTFDQWFSRIWGPTEEHTPKFKSVDQAQCIVNLVIRHTNNIITVLENDPDNIEPIFERLINRENNQEYLDAESWAYGFLRGVELCKNDWKPLIQDQDGSEAFYPIYLLAADNVTNEEMALIETLEQREKLADQITESIAWIYEFWLPYREAIHERTVATSQHKTVRSCIASL